MSTSTALPETDTSPVATPRRPPARRWRDSGVVTWTERVIFGLVLLGLWQLAYEQEWINPILASSPVDVYHYLIDATKDGSLWDNTKVTMEAVIVAFVLASVAGTVVGFALALFPHVDRILEPFINGLNALPRTALAPVTIIYFGLGMTAKVSLAFSVVVFMLLLSTRAGVKSVDRDILEYCRAIGIGKVAMIVKVLFPVAVPSIFAGLRLGLVYSLLGVVTSEIVASTAGLGNLVQSYSNTYNFAGVYGILIVLAVIASLLNGGLNYLESRLLRWSPPQS